MDAQTAGLIRELEEQRDFIAARAARFAGQLAAAHSENLALKEKNKELEQKLDRPQEPPEYPPEMTD